MTIDTAYREEVTSSSPSEVDGKAKKAMLGAAIGYAMDGFDLLILGFMLKAISSDLSLSPGQAASLVTATLIGAVIGGVLFGMLSDRLGRVKVLTWTIVLFAVFTGLCALAQGYWDLLFYRTMAGLGLGGEFGIGMALVAEAWPANKRARASSYVGLGWQLGVLAAAIVTPMLLPVIGWRGMFAIGIFPAVVAYFIRNSLHEPEVFVANKAGKSTKSSLRLLVKDWDTTKLSIGMAILCSVQNFGYYGVMIWLPNYLATRFGFALTQSAIWTTVTIAGMALGIFMFGHIADRIGRRPAFFGYMFMAAVMVVIYSQLTDPYELLVAGAVMGFFVNGMLGGYGALISELFPTAARATAQNVLFNVGRGVGGFGPVVVGTIASFYGFELAIALLATLYILDMVAMWLLIPERRGRELS
ncbi:MULTISPECIES: MFS transporter [Agrobacterium]|jgi:MFS family permease|uniref:MFS family permease n=2 Tax=Agrobacterium tumefaciens complex TaxID=1183400 RepID=A0AAW8LYC6_AGRTU|nr:MULTISPECIES: MFS transporter [Agrobacterium]MCP2136348.1 MFS family permease [Rhizobium sp. SLBN-94]TGE77419.1 MFS transporter [Rhizobium sp. SEMIA 439]KAA1233124.1 MFS transporter [Agrobacterium tumefaciens]KAB0456203.1 MFS transporter [Agrobacterium tumefaciens]KWT79034.1 MFS transporter [Agrobacterium radiobacter]